jgi:hypothetical protein
MGRRLPAPASAVMRSTFAIVVAIVFPCVLGADDEKVTKQLAKLDAEFVKALTDLAKKYDRDQVPEAAHFFASCALSFGAKDDALAPMKASYEASVYLGRLRGGEPLKETAPITGALGNVSTGYKKILDPWIHSARKGGLPEATRTLMFETGVKYELSRGAHEYVQATQRFNALRKAMGLRAILWDFEESRKLILSGWYTCETEDSELKELKRESPFFSEAVEEAKKVARGADKLPELPEGLRSFALVRQYLLNPNARTLRLAYWGGGGKLDYWGLYGIPQLPYREDIPTPTQRFRGETVVKDWVDVEDTIDVGSKKVPFVRYPFPGETDLPIWFSNGHGYMEGGWTKSEYDVLEHGGLPIMIRFFIESTPTDIDASLIDKGGRKLVCRIYVNGDKRVELHKLATVLLLPEKQLDGLTEYTVALRCKIEATPVEKSWIFKTRAK